MYQAHPDRYKKMIYRRLGKSGLKLPVLSLGLWYNFGANNDYETCKEILLTAFDHGITHFDLANNYGPPPGSAEIMFGKIMKEVLMPYRDELIISTKAGYGMWEGPYGDFGSRKYLFASLNQSLERMGLDYVDIFYHHRFDHETDLEETMLALRDIVLQGKALYVGLSNYNSEQLSRAVPMLKALHVPYVITQPSYSMLNRYVERDHLLDTVEKTYGGVISYSALAQGKLSNKYIDAIPSDSRAKNPDMQWFTQNDVTPELVNKLKALKEVADARSQSISQLALAWVLRDPRMTTALIGVSKVSQLLENIQTLDNLTLTETELNTIEDILK